MPTANKGWAHVLATIIVVLIFLTTIISAILSVGVALFGIRNDEEMIAPNATKGVLIVYAGVSVAIAALMGWLSYKMVKCEFNCE